MTWKRLSLITLLVWGLLCVLKILFFNNRLTDNINIQFLFYLLIVGVIGAILVRILGIMNYFEAFFVVFVWLVGGALFDLVVTSSYTGLGIFAEWPFWAGNIVLGLAAFVFHIKRHIAVRNGIAIPGEHHH